MEQRISEKFDNAIKALDIVFMCLKETETTGWNGYFEKIKSCLDKQDVECAVRAIESIPIPNMGGFGEFLERYPELSRSYNNLAKTISNLKVYSRYKMDRPIVEL